MAVTAPSTPYRHMLETLHGLGRAFEARHIAGVREEPWLREQDFGNFQDVDKTINVVVDSALVDMYLKCSSPEDAHWVFAAVAARNITMWTTVMSGHSQHGRVAEALALFDQMMRFEGLANLSNDGALVMQTGAGGRYSLLVHHSVEELRGVRLHRRHDRGPEFRLDPVLLDPSCSIAGDEEGGRGCGWKQRQREKRDRRRDGSGMVPILEISSGM
uniref:Pentatricopeptide repeat-containing protein n=1 Tax=Oryza nivara TaxID=4536 RepID=A0A0E0IQC0_ORYNI